MFIHPYEGDQIRFQKMAPGTLSEDDRMRYLMRDGKLTIQYRKPYFFFGFSNIQSPHKELQIEVPMDMDDDLVLDRLNIESASVDITVEDLNCRNLLVFSTSGVVSLQGMDCDRTEAATVSGRLRLSIPDNTGFTVKADSISGQFDCDFATTGEEGVYRYGNGAAMFSPESSISGGIHLLQTN